MCVKLPRPRTINGLYRFLGKLRFTPLTCGIALLIDMRDELPRIYTGKKEAAR